MTDPTAFKAVFSSKTGLAGYIPHDTYYRVFAFDGMSTGKRDHIVMYRPGEGSCIIAMRWQDQFYPIYQATNEGLGGFDLSFYYDRALAFDYESSGKMDHIICYRPGAGACYIFKHKGWGYFDTVYSMDGAEEAVPGGAGNGIGGWDLRYAWDRLFAFDYDHSKKLDHICIYRRTKKMFCILKNDKGKFSSVYKDLAKGIGGYEMGMEQDYALAFDYDQKGCQDCILFVRPGSNIVVIIRHQGDSFTTAWKSSTGIGDFKLDNQNMRAFVFDYESKGFMDHIGLWYPEHGVVWLMNSPKKDGNWTVKYKQGPPEGKGIGTFDGKDRQDRMLAFDYDGSGKNDHILCWRMNTQGVVQILTTKDHKAQA